MSPVTENLKEASGKLPVCRTEITSGMFNWVRLPNKLKPQNYSEVDGVNVADRWKERLRSYPGRSHGRAETEYEARLK